MTGEGQTKLGNGSWVSVSLMVGILGAALYGAVYATRVVEKLDLLVSNDSKREASTKELASAVSDLQRSVDKLTDATDLRLWIADLARLNPTLAVPALGGPFRENGQRK